jgi:hypothetical protein
MPAIGSFNRRQTRSVASSLESKKHRKNLRDAFHAGIFRFIKVSP